MPSPSGRIQSIDAMRGITVLVMIFVNTLAGVSGMPDWLKHAAATADAMTFPDIVFPAFLFIVGMAIPFAMRQRAAKGEGFWARQQHVLLRTVGLLALGLFMVNAGDGYHQASMPFSIHLWSVLFYLCAILIWNAYSPAQQPLGGVLRLLGSIGLLSLAALYHGGPDGEQGLQVQWWGILGLIGWSYLVCSIIYQISQQKLIAIFIAIALCVAYYVGHRVAPPESFAAALLSQPGHAIHSMIALCGMATAMLFFNSATTQAPNRRLAAALLFAAVLALAAWLLRPWFAISKIGATPSWGLYCAAICIVLFAALHYWIDVRQHQRWLKVIQPAAANPLLIYLLAEFVYALMQTLQLHWPAWLLHGGAGVLFAISYAALMLPLVVGLNRRHIRLQL